MRRKDSERRKTEHLPFTGMLDAAADAGKRSHHTPTSYSGDRTESLQISRLNNVMTISVCDRNSGKVTSALFGGDSPFAPEWAMHLAALTLVTMAFFQAAVQSTWEKAFRSSVQPALQTRMAFHTDPRGIGNRIKEWGNTGG